MKEFIKNISFTKNEIQVILFVLIVVTTGFAVKYYRQVFALNREIVYDYSESDKKFRELSSKSSTDSANKSETTDHSDIRENELYEKILRSEDSLLKKQRINDEEILLSGETEIVNLNTATLEELIDLPGIGESTAERIIEHRNKSNGYKRKEDIMNVKGIGKKKFENIKNYIKTD